MLDAIQVVELCGGLAGSSCSAILASLGARVTKLARPSAMPAFEPAIGTGADRTSLLAALLDRDKQVQSSASSADLPSAVAGADIVICDRITDSAGLPAEVAAYAAFVERSNCSVWVTISAFGLSGPYAGYRGSELIASAAGGVAATIGTKNGGRPSLLPGFQGLLATGQVSALAALHGLDLKRRDERPLHIDVSAQEAVAMVGALPECAHAIYACPGRAGSGRYVAPSGLFPCRDGLVRIVATDNHQWAGVVRAMGEPAWTRGLEERHARVDQAERINREIAVWTRQRDIAKCADELQAQGVPATPLNGPDELLDSPQFKARDFIRPAVVGGVETRAPGRPYTWRATGASRKERGGLSALRVAEFAHVLAGPIAGALLGAMGAEVVRFEELERLDLYRRTGPFAQGIPGQERGAYFAVANHSKRSLAVDIEARPRAALELAIQSDVVLESFGAKRMTRLGVGADKLLARKPEMLFVSLSGFGQSGPMASYRAYANNVHAYGGLSQLTRSADGELADIGTVLADPLASLTAATVIAAWALGSQRAGGIADVSMAEVVACKVAEFIAEAAAGSARTMPAGCDRFPYAPHGIHPCKDGRWLAIAVCSDAEWRALRDALGAPHELAIAEWSSAQARWEARHAIEAAIDSITRRYEAGELFHRLQSAGIAACPAWTGAELIEDPHLTERGFFPRIEHPESSIPNPRLVGLPWRVAGEQPFSLGPPPRLGEYQLEEKPT